MFSNIKLTDNNILNFNIIGLGHHILNSLRRTIIDDIENIGFGFHPKNTIQIIKNTTKMNNQFISHRIALIPVGTNICQKSPFFLQSNDYTFSLNVKSYGPNRYITTDDFNITHYNKNSKLVINNNNIFPHDTTFNTPILIAILRDNEELHVECKLCKGTKLTHASFSPTVVCFFNESSNDTSQPHQSVYHFTIESTGSWYPHNILVEGFRLLLNKISYAIKLIEITKIDNETKYIKFEKETFTLGNIIQEWINTHHVYNCEICYDIENILFLKFYLDKNYNILNLLQSLITYFHKLSYDINQYVSFILNNNNLFSRTNI